MNKNMIPITNCQANQIYILKQAFDWHNICCSVTVYKTYSWTMIAWVLFPGCSCNGTVLSDKGPRVIFAAQQPRRGRYFLPPRDPSNPATLPTLVYLTVSQGLQELEWRQSHHRFFQKQDLQILSTFWLGLSASSRRASQGGSGLGVEALRGGQGSYL